MLFHFVHVCRDGAKCRESGVYPHACMHEGVCEMLCPQCRVRRGIVVMGVEFVAVGLWWWWWWWCG